LRANKATKGRPNGATMTYAKDTTVSVPQSRIEIENTLRRYGADQFLSGWTDGMASIAFSMNGHKVKINLPLPQMTDKKFTMSPTGRDRSKEQAHKEYEKEIRRLWRSLNLIIKAKLEAIECGVTTFEQEFLSNLILPDGQTVGERLSPDLNYILNTGHMTPLMIAFEQSEEL
jgi:hypothetical protein